MSTATYPLRTGLRDAIRRTVAAGSPRGLKPREIAAKIEFSEFTDTAKTPLKRRVANELWRMSKEAGFPFGKRSGRYFLEAE